MKVKIYNDISYICEPKLDDLQYYIYILENSNKSIKIGRSHDIKQRVNSLSNSNAGGSYITRIAIGPATYLRTLEGIMHDHFNKYRVQDSEWFIDVSFEEVVEYLESLYNHKSYEFVNDLRRQAGGYDRKPVNNVPKIKEPIIHYKEENRDLFTVPNDYIYAHCISSDFVMGAGIALEFTKRGVKNRLLAEHNQYWDNKGYIIPIQMKNHLVVNLITKQYVYGKPTYDTLKESLIDLRDYMKKHNKTKVAMPKIGCGLDGLNWDKVSVMIKDIFKDTGIEVLICYI